ncbi:MAG: hypothetical protein US52_C0046G0005, partial [candidate division WS6 bacterium GW2011_GWA2_37_6]
MFSDDPFDPSNNDPFSTFQGGTGSQGSQPRSQPQS